MSGIPPFPCPPKNILLVKTSSLGDVIHNLPVVSDLRAVFPEARIDWVVEESFVEIPKLHPAVHEVIPVALRHWRHSLFSLKTWREIAAARQHLAAVDYDVVLDTQGLFKSAIVALQAKGVRLGYDAASAREPWAARFYQAGFSVPKALHAVERNRRLAGAALGYAPGLTVDYGLPKEKGAGLSAVLLTATSRADKFWPEASWVALGKALIERGLTPLFPGGNFRERKRAKRLADQIEGAQAIPPMKLTDLSRLLSCARIVVGVDTGLSHLAVALNAPTIALYTVTDPALTGTLGKGWYRNLGGKGVVPSLPQILEELDAFLSIPPASDGVGKIPA